MAGLLNRIICVRGVIACFTRSTSIRKSGYVSTNTHFAAGQRHQRAIHDEVRIEDDHLVAGVERGQQGQHQAAAGAAGDEHLAVGMAVLLVDLPLQLLAQRRDALRQGVAVLVALDGVDRRLPNRLRARRSAAGRSRG